MRIQEIKTRVFETKKMIQKLSPSIGHKCPVSEQKSFGVRLTWDYYTKYKIKSSLRKLNWNKIHRQKYYTNNL